MKKAKITIIAALMAGMFGMTSCDDFLTKTPPTQLTTEGFWSSELNAKSWLAGTYHELQDAFNENVFMWGEARADNFYATSYNGSGVVLNAVKSSDGCSNWKNIYRVIGSCNGGIANVDKVNFASEETARSYKGQWYGLRAMMYFYAIRIWGDVPLITTVWDGDVNTKYNDRTPVAEVKKQIEEDLKMAISLLDNEGVYYFNKGAALALKADVAMWFKDYQGCVDTVDELMASGRYKLCSDPTTLKAGWVDPTKAEGEAIFALYWDYEANGQNPFGQNLGLYSKQPHYGMSNSCLQNMLNDKHDVRFWAAVDTASLYTSSSNNKIELAKGVTRIAYKSGLLATLTKYLEISGVDGTAVKFKTVMNDFDGKIPLLRTADALLLKAEALNKLDRPQEALDIVNQVRQRAGNSRVALLEDYPVKEGYPYTYVEDPNTPGAYIETMSRERLILDERQVEFYGEGKRWFDLRRTGYVKDAMDEHLMIAQEFNGEDIVGFEIGTTTGEGRLLFPLHNSVFSSNPNMIGKQNPPYSE